MSGLRTAAWSALGMAGMALGLGAYSSSLAEGPVRPPVPRLAAQDPVVPLASHRAVYNVTLLRSVGSKSPTSARGKVSYEFSGSGCEGYSQVFRQITEIQPGEGATRLSDMRSATYEDVEGTSFSFDVKSSVDSNAPDIVDGRAEKKKNDVMAIELSKPTSQTIDVGSDVLFPTSHLKRIIAAAREGQHILGVKVFDGSDDGKKVYDTTAIIGNKLATPAQDPAAARSPDLDKLPRWPVAISYFEEGKKDQEPAYTLSFELYENGVSRALRFDYGDFVLAGEMTNLELLPSKPCAQ